jgi:hypothetical protein
MKRLVLPFFLLISIAGLGQSDSSRSIRAFPITGYMLDASDSVKIVQLHLPTDVRIADKQIGLLKGIYRDAHADTGAIGTGRCNLIKGDYYYFTINYRKSGQIPREGDLLYTFVERAKIFNGNIVPLATHYIGLNDVYGEPLYNRSDIFSKWTKADEDRTLDSMIADIHFTANYFLENNPSMNVRIKSGKNEGKMVLNTMLTSKKADIIDFFEYMAVRPNLYAGREWKISEVFATWLSEGAPVVIKR